MTEHVALCLLCSHPYSKLFDRRQSFGREVLNRLCTNCGLVYQTPRMTAGELDEFYMAEYRQTYQGGEEPSQEDLNIQKARVVSLLDFVLMYIIEIHRHLDIGSSAGVLLKSFQKAFGNQMVGVEPGTAYRKYAQSQGLEIYASLDEVLQEGQNRFDLVSMAQVLEHLPNPVEYLRTLREEALTLKGWLLIEVPNLYAHDSFEVAHLTSFSAHTLEQTLEKSGFEVVALKKHGWPRSHVIPLYLTTLARLAQDRMPEKVKPERMVALKRKVGLLQRRITVRLMPKRAWIPKT